MASIAVTLLKPRQKRYPFTKPAPTKAPPTGRSPQSLPPPQLPRTATRSDEALAAAKRAGTGVGDGLRVAAMDLTA